MGTVRCLSRPICLSVWSAAAAAAPMAGYSQAALHNANALLQLRHSNPYRLGLLLHTPLHDNDLPYFSQR